MPHHCRCCVLYSYAATGLQNLRPPLTVVRKVLDFGESADNILPSVMTCANYLKMPSYSSKEIVKERLKMAVDEGQVFYLS